jgi:hypothetical protein
MEENCIGSRSSQRTVALENNNNNNLGCYPGEAEENQDELR